MSTAWRDAEFLAVVMALWEARGGDVGMGELVRVGGGNADSVWGMLDELARRGCRVERSPGGVSLVTAGVGIWREVLEESARRAAGGGGGRGRRVGRHAAVFAETGSTNDAAWGYAEAADADGMVVLANHQTAGRGRLGRAWTAKPGQSVLMSVVLHGIAAEALDRLTLLAGLATAVGVERTVSEAGGAIGDGGHVGIRWPNDLVLDGRGGERGSDGRVGRKLAGILVETRKLKTARGVIDAVVVGIGINVAQGVADFPAELKGRGISIFEAAGILVDRLRVVEAVAESLGEYLALQEACGEDAWLGQWKERCAMLGRRLTVRIGREEITGLVLDVAPLQGLVLRDERGATHFASARTSSVVA
jgi:BirA family biotin operon repressor/biotin-[acetyl-CoA-carboxylase] ligase